MRRIIDLSMPLYDGMPVFSGDRTVSVRPYHRLEMDDLNTAVLSLGTHTGTHVDMPYHFYAEGKTLEQMPLERYVGPAHLIDVHGKGAGDRIDVADLEPFAAEIQPGVRLVIRTGWDRMLGNPEQYFKVYPGLLSPAAQWMAERGIGLLGIDTPSVDVPRSRSAHRILLSAGVILVESLVHLDAISAYPFEMIVLPLALQGVDGSPVRAIAMLG